MERTHLQEYVLRAQKGDALARERILKDYFPFVLGTASKIKGNSITKEDDEASIGLLALNEAIDYFDPQKETSFLHFANIIIKRRLTDHYRSISKEKTVSLDNYALAENCTNHFWEMEKASLEYEKTFSSIEYREEFIRYEKMLQEYALDLEDMVNASPKHKDSRQIAFEVAKHIVKDPLLIEYLKFKRKIPVKKLAKDLSLHKRTVERHRKYIIGLCVILLGDFTALSEYIGLGEFKKELERGERYGEH
jgi:RNA polymerase sigma factor